MNGGDDGARTRDLCRDSIFSQDACLAAVDMGENVGRQARLAASVPQTLLNEAKP